MEILSTGSCKFWPEIKSGRTSKKLKPKRRNPKSRNLDDTIYCTYCGEKAVLIRTIGKKFKRKEYLCNDCIAKEERGEPKAAYEGIDNV